jgi:DNA polymerase-4
MSPPQRAWPRIIAHADMDAFYAAVEQLDDPALRGRPILVGGRSNRGVVLTASYEARPYKVASAMPMAKARRLCPDALIMPPRFHRYQEVSRIIMGVFSKFSPEVEALSLDEAFLDMTGSETLFGEPEAIGRRLKDAVREATGGLTVSVGLSGTKYVAKVASGHHKPDGLTVVPPYEAKAWLAPLSVAWLWGAGPKTQERLHRLGLHTIKEVAASDPKFLSSALGKSGAHFHALANAFDPRTVSGHRGRKSIGSEHTLETDIADPEEIKLHLRRSAETIGRRLRQKQMRASGVGVKLKTSTFHILTRQRQLSDPTDVTEMLYTVGVDLLKAFDHPGPFRLVGMSAYDLATAGTWDQLDFFGASARQRKMDTALDHLTARFGENAVRRGSDPERTLRIAATLDFLDDEPET